MIAHLVIHAQAVPQGSVRPGPVKDGRSTVLQGASADHQARLERFRSGVNQVAWQWLSAAGFDAIDRWPYYDDPIVLAAVYWMRRTTTDRVADIWHAKAKPGDLTKFTRAAEDALTGAMYRDDAQVAVEHTYKVIAPRGQEPRCDLWLGHADEEHDICQLARSAALDLDLGMTPPISSAGLSPAGRADCIGDVKTSTTSSSPSGPPFRFVVPAGAIRLPHPEWLEQLRAGWS